MSSDVGGAVIFWIGVFSVVLILPAAIVQLFPSVIGQIDRSVLVSESDRGQWQLRESLGLRLHSMTSHVLHDVTVNIFSCCVADDGEGVVAFVVRVTGVGGGVFSDGVFRIGSSSSF